MRRLPLALAVAAVVALSVMLQIQAKNAYVVDKVLVEVYNISNSALLSAEAYFLPANITLPPYSYAVAHFVNGTFLLVNTDLFAGISPPCNHTAGVAIHSAQASTLNITVYSPTTLGVKYNNAPSQSWVAIIPIRDVKASNYPQCVSASIQ